MYGKNVPKSIRVHLAGRLSIIAKFSVKPTNFIDHCAADDHAVLLVFIRTSLHLNYQKLAMCVP